MQKKIVAVSLVILMVALLLASCGNKYLMGEVNGVERPLVTDAEGNTEIDDEGKITYQIEELYTQETLTADTQLVVELTFMGEIPNYGISYDNHTGEIHRFTVSESGYDGSVILSPF